MGSVENEPQDRKISPDEGAREVLQLSQLLRRPVDHDGTVYVGDVNPKAPRSSPEALRDSMFFYLEQQGVLERVKQITAERKQVVRDPQQDITVGPTVYPNNSGTFAKNSPGSR